MRLQQIPARKRGHLVMLATVLCVFGTSACSHVRPWERGKLAHPTMNDTGLPGPAEEHLYAIQEGAVGGGSTATSGCGCN